MSGMSGIGSSSSRELHNIFPTLNEIKTPDELIMASSAEYQDLTTRTTQLLTDSKKDITAYTVGVDTELVQIQQRTRDRIVEMRKILSGFVTNKILPHDHENIVQITQSLELAGKLVEKTTSKIVKYRDRASQEATRASSAAPVFVPFNSQTKGGNNPPNTTVTVDVKQPLPEVIVKPAVNPLLQSGIEEIKGDAKSNSNPLFLGTLSADMLKFFATPNSSASPANDPASVQSKPNTTSSSDPALTTAQEKLDEVKKFAAQMKDLQDKGSYTQADHDKLCKYFADVEKQGNLVFANQPSQELSMKWGEIKTEADAIFQRGLRSLLATSGGTASPEETAKDTLTKVIAYRQTLETAKTKRAFTKEDHEKLVNFVTQIQDKKSEEFRNTLSKEAEETWNEITRQKDRINGLGGALLAYIVDTNKKSTTKTSTTTSSNPALANANKCHDKLLDVQKKLEKQTADNTFSENKLKKIKAYIGTLEGTEKSFKQTDASKAVWKDIRDLKKTILNRAEIALSCSSTSAASSSTPPTQTSTTTSSSDPALVDARKCHEKLLKAQQSLEKQILDGKFSKEKLEKIQAFIQGINATKSSFKQTDASKVVWEDIKTLEKAIIDTAELGQLASSTPPTQTSTTTSSSDRALVDAEKCREKLLKAQQTLQEQIDADNFSKEKLGKIKTFIQGINATESSFKQTDASKAVWKEIKTLEKTIWEDAKKALSSST